ncbi:MAG: hypothetical protein AB7N91_16860 [Candidatus Tectimicrobiota bacterium]
MSPQPPGLPEPEADDRDPALSQAFMHLLRSSQAPADFYAVVQTRLRQRQSRPRILAWLPVRHWLAPAPALVWAFLLVCSVAGNIWLGWQYLALESSPRGRLAGRTEGSPPAPAPRSIAQFQQAIQAPSGLGSLVTAHPALSTAPSTFGFTPPSRQVLYFQLGTWYAETLAYVRSHDLARTSQRLLLLRQVGSLLPAATPLIEYLEEVASLLQRQPSSGVAATWLALWETVVTDILLRSQEDEGLLWFQTGATLVNLTLASAAGDRAALQQPTRLSAFAQALPRWTVPPHVSPALARLAGLLAQPSLTEPELREVRQLAQTLQQLLS